MYQRLLGARNCAGHTHTAATAKATPVTRTVSGVVWRQAGGKAGPGAVPSRTEAAEDPAAAVEQQHGAAGPRRRRSGPVQPHGHSPEQPVLLLHPRSRVRPPPGAHEALGGQAAAQLYLLKNPALFGEGGEPG